MDLLKSFAQKFYIRNISYVTLLFFGMFFIYGIFINSNDQNAFTLQQAGIESIVERGNLYVDGSSTPQFRGVGDVFYHEGHLYAAKQPGQFFIGAPVYFILHIFGVTYKDNFLLASSLVTWFTSGLMTSLIAIMIFKISVVFTKNKKLGVLTSIFYGLGTMSFPYSGVTHHDVYGTFFIFTSFYFLVLDRYSNPSDKIIYSVLSGAAAGLAVFSSILPLFILFAEVAYLLSFKRWKHAAFFIVALVVFLLPLLFYNYFAFGNPLLPANIAGNFDDTYPVFSFENIINKIRFYFFSPTTAIYAFSPIVILSFSGIFFFPRRHIREKLFLFFQFGFLSSYLAIMTTVGHCQYGPRYLMPALPFLSLGLCGYWMRSNPKPSCAAQTPRFNYFTGIIIAAGVISVVISTVGALQGTMYCSLDIWAFKNYLGKIISGDFPEFPLINIASLLLFIIFFLSVFKYRSDIREYLHPKIALVKETNRLWRTRNFYLINIIFIAFLLRVIFLDKIPNGFYSDEASIGYNAYSIMQTGKDEHGELLPLYFRAFGEYKNPIYIYSAIPFIKIFGLNEFGVRLTSVMFGVLTVFFTYLLARELFNRRVGLWAALFLAISPWHIQFSRIAFEAISLPSLFTIGIFFLIKGMKKGKYLIYSAIFLALSFYSYAPAKVFVPLFLAGFFALNYRRLIRFRSELAWSLLISFFILAPLLTFTIKGHGQSRFNAISIFTDHSLAETREAILGDKYWYPSLFKGAVDYEPFLITYSFLRNYVLHISPDYLFFKGDSNIRHNIGEMGQLYKFEGVLVILGVIFMILRKRRMGMVVLWWFLLFPVSASLTYESIPHAIRSISGLPVFQIIAAVGVVSSFDYVRRIRLNHPKYKIGVRYADAFALVLFIVFALSNIRSYLVRYYKIYPRTGSGAWSYGLKEVIHTAENLGRFDVFSFLGIDDPYIYILFHTKYDPEKWQKERCFNKYLKGSFGNVIGKRQALIVEAGEYPQYQTIQTIFFPDNKPGYEIKEVREIDVRIINFSEMKPEFTGGLKGSYFNGGNFDNLVLSKIDEGIDFNWERNSPCLGINSDNFSVRWEGLIKIDESKEYEFYTLSDDGIRLSIDGYAIIDNWTSHSSTEDKAPVHLIEGWHRIAVEYNDIGYDAIVRLSWNANSIPKTVVPPSHLSFFNPDN